MRIGNFVGLTVFAGSRKEELFIGGEIIHKDKNKGLVFNTIEQIYINEKTENGFYEIQVYIKGNSGHPFQTIRCKPEMLTIHHYQ